MAEIENKSETHSRRFFWEEIRRELDGLPDGKGLNIAHEAVDRHGKGERRDRCAIRWMKEGDEVVEMSCKALMEETNRFANVLKKLGVKKGGRVYVQSERVPELYVSALGALKYGAVFCPLFPAYGPDPVSSRIQKGGDGILVTSEKLYKSRIEPNRERLTCLKKILLTDAATDIGDDALSFSQAMDRAASRFEIPPTNPEDMALLHFTSGTTGPAKAAVHVHEAVLVHYATGKQVFDFRPDDVLWCTADPGWVTGTVYGIVSPLVCGVVDIVDTQDFDPARWLSILESQKVTVWYTAPTAIRRFMRLAPDFFRKYDLSHMRLIFSVGEPLGADAVAWSQKTLGLPIRDTWWQTETGGVMIANLPSSEVKAGFMESRSLEFAPPLLEKRVKAESNSSTNLAKKESLRFEKGGPPCSGDIWESRNGTKNASPETGISAGTWPCAIRTDFSGTWGATTTSSRPQGTWWVRSRWSPCSTSTPPWRSPPLWEGPTP